MDLPTHVKLVEVGPRDGLQNEQNDVPTNVRIELVNRLIAAGVTSLETGSFVSPKWVPKMADTAEVLAAVTKSADIHHCVLVPNKRGYVNAAESGATDIAVFPAVTETMSEKNLNCSVATSMLRFGEITKIALGAGMRVRGYVSVATDCPFEGKVDPERAADMAAELHDWGCYEISLGDTIGTATAGEVINLIEAVKKRVPLEKIAVHMHDTYGQGVANVFAALQCGVATVDTSIAGLGGCPFAPGAAGNVASEDVLYLLQGLGIETGIDLDKMIAAGRFISEHLGRPPASDVNQAITNRCAA